MNRDQYERKRAQYQEGEVSERLPPSDPEDGSKASRRPVPAVTRRRPAKHPPETAPDGTNLGETS